MSESIVYIALGSNLGEREENLKKAVELLAGAGQVKKVSPFYDSAPQGVVDQPRFLNGALEFSTTLTPRALLARLKSIEREMGRDPGGERNGPRVIDLDIILFGRLVIEEEGLVVPHPRMHERAFVLKPLAEIAPDALHPKLKKSVQELLLALPDSDKADLRNFL